ncbi:gel scht [Janthinobacterium sp. HH01]|uniref:hypothetical protein n=1 Tax=Janthinobacterium sp. HH01 TaxID=1198452 RepID=UPI0002AEC289|nr:hypothetical protein [Janthinobacterium sp. HH01]ELX10960.1 gel scht [Janthinobacterium sp. HH01]
MSTMISSGAKLPASGAAAFDAGACLQDWQRHGIQLSFVYSRSLGGLMQTGQGRLFLSADTAAPRATPHAPVQ